MLYKCLCEEKNKLETLKNTLLSRSKLYPEGKIIPAYKKEKYYEYYFVKKTDGKELRTYARKNELPKVKLLAQKAYESELIPLIEERLKLLNQLINHMEKASISSVYDNLNPGRKVLVTPVELPIEEYVKNWKASFALNENTFAKPGNIQTENGEIVRSKTEKIIADMLLRLNVPYVYEPKLSLRNGKIMFPDFAVLNVNNRKTYYWEHNGLMDNTEYCIRAIEKNETYERNGMWTGKELLYTYETSNQMPDLENIRRMIQTFLL